MDARKLARFDHAEHLLACPVCGSALTRGGQRLCCPKGHSFDIARQGYANLLRGGHKHQDYDRASFAMRRRVFQSGLYDAIAQAVATAAEETVAHLDETCRASAAAAPAIVDAGCGEGFFSRAVRAATMAPLCAFDISRDSIQLAAATNPDDATIWLVADLAAIPVQDSRAACVLDIFSPANYREFTRILAAGGRIVKAIPTARHLEEIRQLASPHLKHDTYSNQRIIEHFERFCCIEQRRTVGTTLELDDDVRDALIAMTPMLFNVDAARIDWTSLTRATVEAEVMVGTVRSRNQPCRN